MEGTLRRRVELVFAEQTVALYGPANSEVDERAISTLRDQLISLNQAAMQYLDLFVDRTSASQVPNEQWELEEVEFLQTDEWPLRALFNYTLYGDGDGLWSVEFLTNQDPWRPVRFERRQG